MAAFSCLLVLGLGSKRSSAIMIYFVDDSFVCGLSSFAGPKLEELGDLVHLHFHSVKQLYI